MLHGCKILAVMARSSTTYTPIWQSGETTVIRVPRVLVGDVLRHARKLDTLSESNSGTSLFQNGEKLKELRRSKPVNVATVPLRSPFRYPGGKTWLIPYVRAWLEGLARQDLFIEPFAGGAIASLTVSFEDRAEHVIMAETDEYVAAVWRTILLGQAEWLAEKILQFDVTVENVKKALIRSNEARLTQKERAFLTILRNRVQRGGIMAPGAGLVKASEKNKGIKSRWYPETLARRIRDIADHRDKITFYHGDGFDLMEDYLRERKAAFFIDPPYTVTSRRLYNQWEFDHERLFRLVKKLKGYFLITYDDTEEIRELAHSFGIAFRAVKMKNTHHARKTELIIGRDFKWFDAIAE